MRGHKVELLAPAGNYDSFIGAINAGADAIYVGGEKFSARAYADNFDTETLCKCIKYAHLFGRRVYLTLNTLIKEQEFSEIHAYVLPFYLAGLDGVIIQDFGVLKYLREHFPGMELHASTQMAATGPEFVRLCQEWGISRVVPARELSLSELKGIRDAGIEVECFIHGAMCYCYSGMCLMSSILGGRSGNRGKCAQPCRLPYQFSAQGAVHKDVYTLSLKDMCTIEHIPALIEAGMDSFKIEGRMKRSEYAAGVTALYRKYIDFYYMHPDKTFEISAKDKSILERLYMRSELHDGYLYKHNGKEMVTREAPSYSGLEEGILAEIREKYLGYTMKLPVSIFAHFEVGSESTVTAYTDNGVSVTVSGPIVEEANNAPATEASVSKQLSKLGNTHFILQDLQVSLTGNAFLPNGVLNALRRDVLERLEASIIASYFPDLSHRRTGFASDMQTHTASEEGDTEKNSTEDIGTQNAIVSRKDAKQDEYKNSIAPGLTLLVKTKEQLGTVLKHSIHKQIAALYLEEEAMDAVLSGEYTLPVHMTPVYAMPYILRHKNSAKQRAYLEQLAKAQIRHVLVRNVEELALVTAFNEQKVAMVFNEQNSLKVESAAKTQEKHIFSLVTDTSLYCWNREAANLLSVYAERLTLPFELNAKELRLLRAQNTEQIIYGYIPLMVTANCVYKTNLSCKNNGEKCSQRAELKDRYGKTFTVLTNCKHCYNTIYNSVPLSLHKKYNRGLPGFYRIQFSIEDKEAVCRILNYYENWMRDIPAEFPVKEYTTAHENRQVD